MKTNMHFGAKPGIFVQARALRKNPTRAESILWLHLRKNNLGYKFRRQHPLWIYIVDFYCHPLRLIIEIDGGIHTDDQAQKDDVIREENIKEFDLNLLRFSNEQVCFDIEEVLSEIRAKIHELKNMRLIIMSPFQGAGGQCDTT